MKIFSDILNKLKLTSRNYFRVGKWILVERDLSEGIEDIEPRIPVEFQADAFDDTLNFIRQTFYDKNLDEEECRELKLAREYGHLFPNISYNGKVISFKKMGSGKVYIRNMRKVIQLPPNVLFTFAGYTDPAYRGKNIYPYLNRCTTKMARDLGYKFIRAMVSVNNNKVIQSMSKPGLYYEIARFYTIRILFWNFVTLDIGKAKACKKIPLTPES